MTQYIKHKIPKIIKQNWCRLLLNAVGLIVIILYNFIFFNPLETDYSLLAGRWIESSLWFGIIVSASVFLFSVFGLLLEIALRKEISPKLPSKKIARRVIGILFAFAISICLIVILVLQIVCWRLTPFWLTWISVIAIFLTLIMDYLLEIDGIALKVDLPILLTMLLTIVVFMVYDHLNIQEPFIMGFCGGVTAFQVILNNMLINPTDYSVKKVLGL